MSTSVFIVQFRGDDYDSRIAREQKGSFWDGTEGFSKRTEAEQFLLRRLLKLIQSNASCHRFSKEWIGEFWEPFVQRLKDLSGQEKHGEALALWAPFWKAHGYSARLTLPFLSFELTEVTVR